ncbi:MAG TPA: hypothetical protein VJ508_14735, partial [Saprospiraceae bacterium]|nr:hypothetical protein [Saprospiraceae bacterium]
MKENFDDIIRRRWEERDFPVDDQHREEMAQLLDREKRRKGFPIWWFGGLGGLLLLSGIASWLMHSSTDPVAPSIEKVSPKTPATEEKNDQ